MLFKRAVAALSLVLGLVGSLLCMATVVAIWSVSSRLFEANEAVFEMLGGTLSSVQTRVSETQIRVHESKVTVDQLGQGLADWVRKNGSEKLASRQQIDQYARQAQTRLEQADLWLDTSLQTIQGARKVLQVSDVLGDSIDQESLDQIVERLNALHTTLQQAMVEVEEIQQGVARLSDNDRSSDHASTIHQLVVRSVATLTNIDQRMSALTDQLSAARTQTLQWKTVVRRYLAWSQIVGTGLVFWMAMGQFALVTLGWRQLSARRELNNSERDSTVSRSRPNISRTSGKNL